jgi:hypothetical protein
MKADRIQAKELDRKKIIELIGSLPRLNTEQQDVLCGAFITALQSGNQTKPDFNKENWDSRIKPYQEGAERLGIDPDLVQRAINKGIEISPRFYK